MELGLSPDRRLYFGAGGRSAYTARALAARLGASVGSRGGGSLAPLLFPLLFPPTLISVTPNTGPSGGGTVVDLAGQDFQPGATVDFGGVPATGVTFVSSSHITATTPAHAGGAVNVRVVNPDSQSSTLVNGYLYTAGLFVAVGGNNGTQSATSQDGITWIAQTIPSGTYRGLVWNGSIFLAVGDAGKTATSPDGINWTPGLIVATEDFYGVTWNGSFFCAVGNDTLSGRPISRVSTDGITWNATQGLVSGAAVGPALSVAWNGALFCVVGQGGTRRARTSVDGLTWALGADLTGFGGAVTIVAFGALFVAVSTDNTHVGTDAINWTQGALPPGTNGATSAGVAFNGAVYATAGINGKAATSLDGITWAAQTFPTAGVQGPMVFGAGLFVSVGGGQVTNTSPDGITWTQRTMPSNQTWAGLAFAT